MNISTWIEEEEEDAFNLKSSVLVCLPQHGGMGSSRLIFDSPLLGPSGYPTDLVTGQPSAGKGRAQGYQPCHPPSATMNCYNRLVRIGSSEI